MQTINPSNGPTGHSHYLVGQGRVGMTTFGGMWRKLFVSKPLPAAAPQASPSWSQRQGRWQKPQQPRRKKQVWGNTYGWGIAYAGMSSSELAAMAQKWMRRKELEARAPELQARLDQKRMERATAMATGSSRRQGRL